MRGTVTRSALLPRSVMTLTITVTVAADSTARWRVLLAVGGVVLVEDQADRVPADPERGAVALGGMAGLKGFGQRHESVGGIGTGPHLVAGRVAPSGNTHRVSLLGVVGTRFDHRSAASRWLSSPVTQKPGRGLPHIEAPSFPGKWLRPSGQCLTLADLGLFALPRTPRPRIPHPRRGFRVFSLPRSAVRHSAALSKAPPSPSTPKG